MRASLIVLGVCLAVCVGVTHGQVVITHTGANDPLDEGWSQNVYDNGGAWTVTAGPLAPDPAFPGVDSWQISADKGEISYAYELTPEQQAAAFANGFRITGTWRMEWCHEDTNYGGGNFVGARMPEAWVQARQGYGGDPIDTATRAVKIFDPNWPNSPVVDLGADGYHTVQYVYDPGDGMVDVYANGALALENVALYAAGNTGTLKVMFGGANAGRDNDGENDYSFVQFEIIPEPATIALLTLAVPVLLRSRRRA